ncbi:MAG: LacI family DNA-binding transcriptional regulator [Victivallaceae bacterium]|nr:LacI family DNA-binding transcriptional regulator [Victivallaceae bacterium]
MKLTVRQIAKETGVSPATISRVLNGQEGIGEATRNRIYEFLEQNPGAVRSKKTKSRRNIALLMPRNVLNSRVFFDKLNSFLALFNRRWNLLLLPPDTTAEELELARIRNEIAGLILFGFRCPEPSLAAVIERIAHVWVNSHNTPGQAPCVLMGNEQAGRLAARYLLARKCRRCAALEIPGEHPGFPVRIDGFRYEFFSQKKECTILSLQTPMLETLSLPQLDEIFSSAVQDGKFNGFDGIFLPESYLAPGLHLAIRRFRTGEKFPELISCSDSPELLAGLWPRPAIIGLGEELLAEYACRELFRRIDGNFEQDKRASVFITPQLQEA